MIMTGSITATTMIMFIITITIIIFDTIIIIIIIITVIIIIIIIIFYYCGVSFKVDLPALNNSSHNNKLLAIPVAPVIAFLSTR